MPEYYISTVLFHCFLDTGEVELRLSDSCHLFGKGQERKTPMRLFPDRDTAPKQVKCSAPISLLSLQQMTILLSYMQTSSMSHAVA